MIGFALHIPDGFLSGPVAAGCALVAMAAVVVALRLGGRDLDDARAPLVGVLCAFVFAAQMLNVPIAAGTSGHLLGAALVAVLLGPWLACLAMTVVVCVQALAFADGGLTALGANVLNTGVLGALLAGVVVAAGARLGRQGFLLSVGGAAWLAVMAAALATSAQLAWSGTVPFAVVAPAMLGVHAVIGLGEAAVTVAAISAVLAARPDLIAGGRFTPARRVTGLSSAVVTR